MQFRQRLPVALTLAAGAPLAVRWAARAAVISRVRALATISVVWYVDHNVRIQEIKPVQ